MKMSIPRTAFAGALGLLTHLALLSSPTRAADEYSFGHADLGIGYEGGELEPHWHLGSGAIVNGSVLTEGGEYAPSSIITIVPNLPQPRPGDAAFDALGVQAGEAIWVIPKSGASAAGKPNLGLGAEELEPGEWLNDSITLSLVNWSGPGHFSLFDANSGMTALSDLLFSTAAPEATLDLNSYTLFAGGHEHYNWAFTAPGYYELTFEFTGTHLQDGFKTATETFTFHVIPEPSTLWLVAFAGGGCLFWRARFRSRAIPVASLER